MPLTPRATVILTRPDDSILPRIFSRFPNIEVRVVDGPPGPVGDPPVTGVDSIERAIAESRAPICVVMDPGHPADKVQELVEAVEDGAAVAVGSRKRTPFLTLPLTPARDAGSGFYAFRRDAGPGSQLEILARATTMVQVPIDELSPGRAPSLGEILRVYRARNAWPFRVAKFLTTGATGLAIHLAVLRILVEGPGWRPKPAAVPAFIVAMSWNYMINRLWTFRAKHVPVAGSYVRYATGAVAGLGVQLGVMHLLSHIHYIAAASLGIVAGTVCTFLTSQLWAFSGKGADSASQSSG